MNTLVWHAATLTLAIATVALVLVTGHATVRSFALALGAGAAVVVGMLVIGAAGILEQPASAATTPTIAGAKAGDATKRAVRLAGVGWEVGARPVRVVIVAPGGLRRRTVDALPSADGRIDVIVAAPFAHRAGCTVTAVQITILGALRASSACTARQLAQPD